MYKNILNNDQVELLPLVSAFKRTFYLVGGTAIALQIGHRRSVDFDLFREGLIHPKKVLEKIQKLNYQPIVTRRVTDQLNLTVNNVKFTFFQYPFEIERKLTFENIIGMPSLLDLAAMKAYALGRRAKWKDYVDLYFIIRDHYSIGEISSKADKIFGHLFSEKQFRAQLCYFDDVDYSEEIEFVTTAVNKDHIKDKLVKIAASL